MSSCSFVMSSNLDADDVPALLTNMSMPPNRCAIALTAASTAASSDTSAGAGMTSLPVAADISAATFSRSDAVLDTIATFAPSSEKRVAAARPMPSLPPVTIATLPCNPRSMRSVFLSLFCPARNAWRTRIARQVFTLIRL